MSEPELTDTERARLRVILQQPAPSFKDKMKPYAAGLFTGIVGVSAVLFGYGQWNEAGEANEITKQANHGNLNFDASFSGPDEKNNGQQLVSDEKVILEDMFRRVPSYIKITVNNEGPQNASIANIGLQLGGGEMLWASTLVRDGGIPGCAPEDWYDNVACIGLFPKMIPAGHAFTFDFPMSDSVDRLMQNGGDTDGGIKFTLETVGAGEDQIEFSTGITIR